jgi:gliding motility-associated-like protein
VSSACETLLQSVAVAAEDDAERSYVFIPNVFSPNHDGINDVFRAFFANEASVDDFLLRVYDRWGNMIYETTDYQSGWEGPFRDKAMDSAIFAYYIKASVFACHEPLEIFKYGDVTVVK